MAPQDDAAPAGQNRPNVLNLLVLQLKWRQCISAQALLDIGMLEVASGIWEHAPVWIWPLFLFLLLAGLSFTRTRRSSVIPYYFAPLLGLIAVDAINQSPYPSISWTVFFGTYIAGIIVGCFWQDKLILEKIGRRLRLRGEWMTLVILMVIFFSNFATGVFDDLAPETRRTTYFVVAFAGLLGVCSGTFAGRALRVITLGSRSSRAE